jgi:hypothetical protein
VQNKFVVAHPDIPDFFSGLVADAVNTPTPRCYGTAPACCSVSSTCTKCALTGARWLMNFNHGFSVFFAAFQRKQILLFWRIEAH